MRSRFAESYRFDVLLQNHSYSLGMFRVLLGDDGQVANLISVVVLEILQRFLEVQSDLVRNLVGRHDSSRQGIICSSRKKRERKRLRVTDSFLRKWLKKETVNALSGP